MYITASQFTDDKLSKSVWQRLYDKSSKFAYQDLEISCHRMMIHDKMTVILSSSAEEEDFSSALVHEIRAEMGKGTPVLLSQDIIEIIKNRRMENRFSATKNALRTGKRETVYESHTPRQVSITTPVLQDSATKEILAVDYSQSTFVTLPYKAEPKPPTPKQSTKTPLPFLVEFQRWSERDTEAGFEEMIQSAGDADISHLMSPIVNRLRSVLLQRTKRYFFVASALRMHEAVHNPLQHDWIPQDKNIWIELHEAIETPHGAVRGIFLQKSYPESEIEIVAPRLREPRLHEFVTDIYKSLHGYWTVTILNEQSSNINWKEYHCSMNNEFNYDEDTNEWVFLSTHDCPYKECEQAEDALISDHVKACERCKSDCLYWSSWLRTALLMVQGEYATSPEPEPFEETTISYKEDVMQTVGKGKNRHKIPLSKQKEVTYTLIKYDVSVAAPPPTPEHLHTDAETRHSWLATASKEEIVYERRHIAEYERHFQKQEGTYKVTPHTKYIPMLRERKREQITRIVASQYEEKKEKDVTL